MKARRAQRLRYHASDGARRPKSPECEPEICTLLPSYAASIIFLFRLADREGGMRDFDGVFDGVFAEDLDLELVLEAVLELDCFEAVMDGVAVAIAETELVAELEEEEELVVGYGVGDDV